MISLSKQAQLRNTAKVRGDLYEMVYRLQEPYNSKLIGRQVQNLAGTEKEVHENVSQLMLAQSSIQNHLPAANGRDLLRVNWRFALVHGKIQQ